MKKSLLHESFFIVAVLTLVIASIFYADYRRSHFFDEETGFWPYLTNKVLTWGEDVVPINIETRVAFVIDGDTFELTSEERVRLIGINAPESGSPGFSDARTALQDLIKGKTITLEKDVSDRDEFGRLLRYVWVGDLFINEEMVLLGLARATPYPPDVTWQERLRSAEEEAHASSRGLWGTDVTQDGPIVVSDFHPNAAGNDRENLNDEYVALQNVSPQKITITGWHLSDANGNEYIFPTFTFNSGAYITLFTGTGEQTPAKLYWGRVNNAIWDNSGDTLSLRNREGELILEYSY